MKFMIFNHGLSPGLIEKIFTNALCHYNTDKHIFSLVDVEKHLLSVLVLVII